MSKYYAYIRVSTDKQTLENQKHKILEFAFNKKIQIEEVLLRKLPYYGIQIHYFLIIFSRRWYIFF